MLVSLIICFRAASLLLGGGDEGLVKGERLSLLCFTLGLDPEGHIEKNEAESVADTGPNLSLRHLP